MPSKALQQRRSLRGCGKGRCTLVIAAAQSVLEKWDMQLRKRNSRFGISPELRGPRFFIKTQSDSEVDCDTDGETKDQSISTLRRHRVKTRCYALPV